MDEANYLENLYRLWQQHWPSGVAREAAYPQGRVSITEYLRHWAARNPDRPCLHWYGRAISYGELERLSDAFARYLLAQQVGKGDRVAVFLPNCPQFHIVFFGILKIGAVHVPVNPMFTAEELRYELNDAGAEILVALDALHDVFVQVGEATPVRQVLVTSGRDFLPDTPQLPIPEILAAPPVYCRGARSLLSALETAPDMPLPPAPGWDDIAAINYTGGTTGMPKGCIHTHGDMAYTAATGVACGAPIDEEAVLLCYLPLFWIAGEDLGILLPVFAGASCVLMARWDPAAVLAAIERYRVQLWVGLVDNVVELMEHPNVRDYDLSSQRSVAVTSFVKKLTVEYRQHWRQLTGSVLREGAWGMTETHTMDTFTTGMQDDDFDLGSAPIFVGLPMPGTEFKVVDFETGALQPLESEGELVVRTPSLFKGYWNKPEATREALRDGWLHTGDIGMIDAAGYIHYLGRRKEMLKVKGMSVFPAELETIIGRHPAVMASGVIGRADEGRGDVPVAFIKLVPGTDITEQALLAWCRERMAAYKLPEIRFVDALPMTATGKVKKEALRGLL